MSFNFPESFRLDGKVAVIGGVGPTNGRHFASALSQAGASVCLIARTPAVSRPLAEELRAQGGRAFYIEADLTDPKQVDDAFARTLEACGRIDVLFNHVGSAGAIRDIVDLNLEQWRNVFAVNLDAMFLCTKAAAKIMIERGHGGSIINTGSTAGRLTLRKLTPYATAKAAVEHFTRCMASELAPHRIRVNCIRLGTFENAGPILDRFSEGFAEWWLRETPMHRWGQADEAAGAALYLASDASNYVTGAVLPVTGGMAVV